MSQTNNKIIGLRGKGEQVTVDSTLNIGDGYEWIKLDGVRKFMMIHHARDGSVMLKTSSPIAEIQLRALNPTSNEIQH